VHDAALDIGSVDVDVAIVVLGRELGVVAEHSRDVGEVVFSLDQAFSGVQRLSASELVAVSLKGVRHSVEQRAPLGRMRRSPWPVIERRAGGLDRRLGVFARALLDSGDQ
jgi:hypothetical protein